MITFGYLLPTRDAVAAQRPAVAPLLQLAERAEALGFDGLWVGDSPMARPRHDPLTLLSAVAARTQRVSLGTSVLLGTLRHPLALAHEAATLDLISEGRFILGMGSGFAMPATEQQCRAFGVDYESRSSRLEETLTILRMLWDQPGRPVTFEGRHFALDEVSLPLGPFRPGGPPIWLPGDGAAAQRRAGRLADGWLPYPPSPDRYAAGWQRVREAAQSARRPTSPTPALYVTLALSEALEGEDPEKRLRRSVESYYSYPLEAVSQVQAMFSGSAAEFCEWLTPYLEAGARHILLRLADEQPQRSLEAVAELVLSRLRDRDGVGVA